jgi:hypothetical protein
MSHSQTTLQKPDAQFLEFINTINEQCTQHPEWANDPSRLATLGVLYGSASAAYAANADRATHTLITSANKKHAFAELKHFSGTFINYLEVNDNVPDTALEYMGLRPRHQPGRQPLPPPQELPVLSVEKIHDEMIFYVARPEHDQPTAGVGLPHYHGFKLRWKYDGATEWHEIVSTRLHATLYFDHEDEGKRIIFTAAWVNPRLQEGPWTTEMTEIVG